MRSRIWPLFVLVVCALKNDDIGWFPWTRPLYTEPEKFSEFRNEGHKICGLNISEVLKSRDLGLVPVDSPSKNTVLQKSIVTLSLQLLTWKKLFTVHGILKGLKSGFFCVK